MQRVAAATIVALALCSPPAHRRSAGPATLLSLELRLPNPAIGNGADVAVTFRIGSDEREPFSFVPRSIADLAQYLEAWRESVTELVYKSEHRA
jgi:hypothetical protein